MNEIETYLGYFPMRYMRVLDGSSLKCLMLIFKMAKEPGKSYRCIEIPSERQKEAGLNTQSFIRGIKKLEDNNIIFVVREVGKPFKISVNDSQLTDQDKNALRNGHKILKARVKR